MSRSRRLIADWEFWQAVAIVALVAWIAARSNRVWLVDAVQSLAWAAHGVVPFVPEASPDRARALVDAFVALAFPATIASFVCGFLAFHAEAEARRQRETAGEQ